MGRGVQHGVRGIQRSEKSSNFDAARFQNFGCSRNKEGCFPNASMLQKMMHIRESSHLYRHADKGER